MNTHFAKNIDLIKYLLISFLVMVVLTSTSSVFFSIVVAVGLLVPMEMWCVQKTAAAGTRSKVASTTFTVKNNCPRPIWPGTLSGNGAAVLGGGGFLLQPNASTSFQAPPGWSGRFWGRTDCVFDPSGSTGKCLTGDCAGTLQCTAGGEPPVSLAEFTLGGDRDFYDVSLVDGYNLEIGIQPSPAMTDATDNCKYAGCVVDLNDRCPAELRVTGDSGQTVACKSACSAFGTEGYCCTGSHGSPGTCGPTRYSRMFKKACPTAYSYAYDDASSTCTCPTGSDYVITFCPSSSSSSSSSSSTTKG